MCSKRNKKYCEVTVATGGGNVVGMTAVVGLMKGPFGTPSGSPPLGIALGVLYRAIVRNN